MDYHMSIIIGFTIGILIGSLYSRSRKRYKGPASDDMRSRVFEFGGECYIFDPEITICSP